jgi:hypothetical protein
MEWKEIGDGDEAFAFKGEIGSVEGLGGIVRLRKKISVVKRIGHKGYFSWQGHDVFCRNLAAKLLDYYFLKRKKYAREHVPLPLGSFNNENESGYYYEFVPGKEGWDRPELEELSSFIDCMTSFGFGVSEDIFADSGGGKNIIFQEGNLWKRIDYGTRSCPYNYECFEKQSGDEKKKIERAVGKKNYKTMALAARYGDFRERNMMKPEDIDKLIIGVFSFRKILEG